MAGNWFVRTFEDSKTIRASARFVALMAVLWGAVVALSKFSKKVEPIHIHIIMSLLAIVLGAYSLNFILTKIYKKLGNEHRIFRHPIIRYRKALVKAIRLSALDGVYFNSLILIKVCRILTSTIVIVFLTVYISVNDHSHTLSFYVFSLKIVAHELLDYVISIGIISSIFVVFWQIAEINIISRGTAKLVNGKKNSIVYKRRRLREQAKLLIDLNS